MPRGEPVPGNPPVPPRVVISDTVTIPAEVVDLDSFCKWLHSDQAPKCGKFSWLAGTIWVDFTLEERSLHSRIKWRITRGLEDVVGHAGLGLFLSDGVLRITSVKFYTVPDGMFVSLEALRDRRIQRMNGEFPHLYLLEGTPEMTLEVVSPTSGQKDIIELRDRYHTAGVLEYWLVDVRQPDHVHLAILRRGPRGYLTTRRRADGWLPSGVFGRSFRLTQGTDCLGDPLYSLEVR
jgi:Uma2 family endonuclease